MAQNKQNQGNKKNQQKKKIKMESLMSLCPVCQSRDVGRIAQGQYYCWSCLVEFNGAAEVFRITAEGNLAKIEEGG